MEELLKHILPKRSQREMSISLMAMVLLLFFSSVSVSCYHKKAPSNFSIPDSIQEAQISSRILKGRHYSPNLKKETNNNVLTDDHIARIVAIFAAKEPVPHTAVQIDNQQIADNDYNLSVSSYVEAKDTREVIDIKVLNAEVAQTVVRINELRADIEGIIREIEG